MSQDPTHFPKTWAVHILRLYCTVADPADCIRGGANFEIFSIRGRGGSETRFTTSFKRSCSQLPESGICFSIRGVGVPGAPLYRSATAVCR